MCGIWVYGLCGIQGACGCKSNVSSMTLFVFPAGNTALKLLISLLHCEVLQDKVGRNIVNKATSNSLAVKLAH